MNDAKALEDAGAYAVVLETVPASLGATITQQLACPTIGIGAGPYCSGQVQVLHDILGLFPDLRPKHARRFLDAARRCSATLRGLPRGGGGGTFPSAAESHLLDEVRQQRIERDGAGDAACWVARRPR